MLQHSDLVGFLKNTTNLANDQTAVKAMSLYPTWEIGESVSVGDRRQYEGKLYKVAQGHTTQAGWTPNITPALWVVIDEIHAGTIEDPIPAAAGMEYTYGLCYIENGTIYVCKRTGEDEGGKIVLQYLPSQLVGQYFELVS